MVKKLVVIFSLIASVAVAQQPKPVWWSYDTSSFITVTNAGGNTNPIAIPKQSAVTNADFAVTVTGVQSNTISAAITNNQPVVQFGSLIASGSISNATKYEAVYAVTNFGAIEYWVPSNRWAFVQRIGEATNFFFLSP